MQRSSTTQAPMTARFRVLVLCCLAIGACAAPVGSFATPVASAPAGSSRVSVSGGTGRSWGDRPWPLGQSDRHSFVGGHVEVSQGDRQTFAFGGGALVPQGSSQTRVSPVLSFRGEAPLAPQSPTTLFVLIQAMTVRVNEDAKWNLLETSTLPVIAPLVGLRRYVTIGSGGIVVSQGIWAAWSPPSLVLPGSLAIDLPLALLHVLPELRWDLSAGAFRDLHAGAMLAGYVSVALQLD